VVLVSDMSMDCDKSWGRWGKGEEHSKKTRNREKIIENECV
jgi:hypothetical protein